MFFKIPPLHNSNEPETTGRDPNVREGVVPASFKEEDHLLVSLTADAGLCTTQICATCRQTCREGERICPHCKTAFPVGKHTQVLSETIQPERLHKPFMGTAVSGEQNPITFEIAGQPINVPVAEVVTVGRLNQITASMLPNVNLDPYRAFENGVSRIHMKIVRKSILIYAVDMGSSNGTFLNGAKLTPHRERLLRSGDELQLGNLKLKVKF
jgi:hypothetical protein